MARKYRAGIRAHGRSLLANLFPRASRKRRMRKRASGTFSGWR